MKLAIVIVLLLIPVNNYSENSQNTKKKYPVRIQVSSNKDKKTGKLLVEVMLFLESGWQVYANQVENEELNGHQTTLKILGGKFEGVKIFYPRGELAKVSKDVTFRVYKKNIVIRAEIKRLESETSPLELAVFVHPISIKFGMSFPSTVLKQKVP